MSVELEKDNRMLSFKTTISLEDFAKICGLYGDLVELLTGKMPSYQDFTAWLEREGYVE